MIVANLSVRCQVIDELREYLGQARTRIAMGHAELLRNLPDGAAAEHFLQLAAADRRVLAGADPRSDLLREAAVLQLADDPGQAAVLLDQLQRHHHQRALRLLRRRAGSTTHQTAKQTVKNAHGSTPF